MNIFRITRNLNMQKIFRMLIISFFAMMIFTYFIFNREVNYYSLASMPTESLAYQLLVFLFIFVLLIIYNYKFKVETLSILICTLWLFYLFIFSISAPSVSLTVGAIIFSVPAIYYSISYLLKKNTDNKILKSFLYSNLVLGFLLIVSFVIRNSVAYQPHTYLHAAHISDIPIIDIEGIFFILIGVIFAIVVLFIFFFSKKMRQDKSSSKFANALIVFTIVLVFIQVIYFCLIMFSRVRSLYSSTYDFGLFTQMFYSMRSGLGMITTLERSIELSHLAIHVSPIYYLMLPIFYVFPFPETLNILQIIVVTIGIIPTVLIAKEFKFSRLLIALVVLMYVFNPAIMGSSFYDLHENCFLSPLLLFVFYFLIKQKTIPLIIFMVLTLLVKEDASIYLVFIGLFGLLGLSDRLNSKIEKRKNFIHNMILIFVPIVYFLSVTTFMGIVGEGAMYWRYAGLNAYPDYNLIGLVISIFQNPSFVFANMFSPEKIYYALFLMLSFGTISLFSKRIVYYILLVPFLLFNLMSSYVYQAVFGYQYYYGSAVLVFIIVLLVFRDRAEEQTVYKFENISNKFYLLAIVLISALGFTFLSTKANSIIEYYTHKEFYDDARELLTSIPKDKKVLAHGYLTAYLSDRRVIYDYAYTSLYGLEDGYFDYIILDVRGVESNLDVIYMVITHKGYVLDEELSLDYVLVYYYPN